MKNIFNQLSRGWQKLRTHFEKSAKGNRVVNDNQKNKSMSLTRDERREQGVDGLLPYRVDTNEDKLSRALTQMRHKSTSLEKYMYLFELEERDTSLFYQLIQENIEEVMPLIYTPTVGEACEKFSEIFETPKGLYITPEDKGRIRDMLDNWTEDDVRVIVMTDGERILGLGDLGANGMGIPIGKLALYTACGGVDPAKAMPVMFDVGTNNDALREDPLYIGYPHKRLDGDAYFELMQEFVDAVQDKFPKAMIQFEDFLTPKAFELLDLYQDKITCFNDDIQGTAAVALAGVYVGAKEAGVALEDVRIMFVGAGSAATGIGDLMVAALEETGMSKEDAYARLSFIDSQGLITKDRDYLADHKKPYAQDLDAMDLMEAIETVKPHILIGATGSAGTFTQEVIEKMSELNEQPVIFALSNPTSLAECTAEEAYEWSKGKALFASGSPFPPVDYNGDIKRPGQGNNAYIFPGLGLGTIASEAKTISTEMFLSAAKALAEMVTEDDLKVGAIYPPLKKIREVSRHIAKAVMKTADEQGLARVELPKDLDSFLDDIMFDTGYASSPIPMQQEKKKRYGR